MPEKVRWGVLGVAGIAVKKVIPAMQRGAWSEVTAIASRDLSKARQAAVPLGIAKAYGSYEELLADPAVDAIYNPLPNHLHVPWSIRAAEAGKHVLCEKPIGLTAAESLELIRVRNRTGVKIGEAFMVHSHPQWLRAREIAASEELGDLRSIIGAFSYFNRDPRNIRNVPAYGGGAIMDIGCYPITMSRFLFRQEPRRVLGLLDRDPEMGTDRLSSAILEFPGGHSIFTCSTQLVPYQRMNIMGTRASIELPIPFNAPPDRPTELFVDTGADLFGGGRRREEFPVCDQYTIQGDLFSRAIRENAEVPSSIEDGVWNMAVLDALFRSSQSGHWEAPVALV